MAAFGDAQRSNHRRRARIGGIDQRIPQGLIVRQFLLAFAALALAGCAGIKLGGGYRFDTKEFFLQLEKPLEAGLKK